MLVHRRSPRPERSMLADHVLADLELGWEAQVLHVPLGLGRVQAEPRVVPSPSFVWPLGEVPDRYEPVVWPTKLPDDPAVDDLVGHRSHVSRTDTMVSDPAIRAHGRPGRVAVCPSLRSTQLLIDCEVGPDAAGDLLQDHERRPSKEAGLSERQHRIALRPDYSGGKSFSTPSGGRISEVGLSRCSSGAKSR